MAICSCRYTKCKSNKEDVWSLRHVLCTYLWQQYEWCLLFPCLAFSFGCPNQPVRIYVYWWVYSRLYNGKMCQYGSPCVYKQYASSDFWHNYVPLWVLFHKWDMKGGCLHKWWGKCYMRCLVKFYFFSIY